MSEAEAEEEILPKSCKYCHENVKDDGIRPCRCTMFVHKDCLKEWEATRVKDQGKCEICRVEYTMEEKFNCNKFGKNILTKFSIIFLFLFGGIFIPVFCVGYPIINNCSNDREEKKDHELCISITAGYAIGAFGLLAQGMIVIFVAGCMVFQFKIPSEIPHDTKLIRGASANLCINLLAQLIGFAYFKIRFGINLFNYVTYGLGMSFLIAFIIVSAPICCLSICILNYIISTHTTVEYNDSSIHEV